MCELYCDYKKKNKTWKILEISSAYRDAKNQARVMIDTYINQGRRKMSEIYVSDWNKAVNLISYLYYDGNHLRCSLFKCLHDPLGRICPYHNQQTIFKSLPSNEQQVFDPNKLSLFNHMGEFKKNRDKAKKLMEAWLSVSKMKSDHQLGRALAFSSNTPADQRKDFLNLVKSQEYNLFTSTYKSGNFHVYQK